MQSTYTNPVYPYFPSKDLNAAHPVHYPVVIVGAGPGGLAMAIDFALQGIATVVLDDNNTVSVGSRAICFAKRTLEIMNRLGCAKRMTEKGVTWQKGKVFFKEELVYDFNLLPEENHEFPAFINLQQYYFEEYLVDRTEDFDCIDLRWKSKVTDVQANPEYTELTVTTDDGDYQLTCDYLLCADGSKSPVRTMLGLDSKGKVFQDRFLIADVLMKADFPTERWFWFDPPFHPNQSALLHKQPDGIWRIDLQLGWDADPEEEKKEAVIRPRIQAMLGDDIEFDLEWSSVYTFQCRKMDSFVHHRVVFVGDAAHQVSPFGARGANGCIQSAENLVWKLSRILKGTAPESLLQTYNLERQQGAQENILNSTRATDFITPKNGISRLFRDQTLCLAKDYPFARSLVNSGRLSEPCRYTLSPLNGPDDGIFTSPLSPGVTPKDAPVNVSGKSAWLLNLLGNRFVFLFVPSGDTFFDNALIQTLSQQQDLHILVLTDPLPEDLSNPTPDVTHISDPTTLLMQRFDLSSGAGYLFRPDQVISARWKNVTLDCVPKAIRTAMGFPHEQKSSSHRGAA